MGFCVYTSFCPSCFALILMGNRELVTLLFCWCLLTISVPRFFLMVPWASLQFVIEAVPDHTQVLFLYLQVD